MAFLVGIQLARGLGVAGYGLYGSAMAAAGLGATFASGGLKLHATRDLSSYLAQGDDESAAQLVKWSLRNVVLIGIAAAVAVGIYTYWGLKASPVLTGSTMAVTALMAVLALVGAILSGAGKLVLGPALDTAMRPAAQSVLLWIALLTTGVIKPGLAMGLTAAAIIVALPFGWRTVWHVWRTPQTRSASNKARTDDWRRASATMGLTTVIHSAEAAIPLLVVGAFSSLEQAGLFRVSVAIMVFSNLPYTMMAVMVPAMASSLYQREDTEQLRRLALAAATVMLFPTLAIAGCLWMFGESLLALAFGSDYRAAWPIMSVLAGASVLSAMGGISVSLLHAARHDAVVTSAFAVSLAVTCNALVIAVVDGSAVAIAWAVLAGILVRTAYLVISAYRLVGINPTIFGALPMLMGRLWRRK